MGIRLATRITLLGVLLTGLTGCVDQGTTPPLVPTIVSVSPDSAGVGDTVLIQGQNFGSSKGSSVLSIGGVPVPDSAVYAWSNSQIDASIPAGIISTAIVVTVNGVPSNVHPYHIKGFVPGSVSFALSIHPILLENCALSGCHVPPKPTGGLDLTTYASLRTGGATFGSSVVAPGDSSYSSADVHTGSGIMKMLRNVNNPYGNFRMPLGGPYASTGLPDSFIVRIGTWITQGAQNN